MTFRITAKEIWLVVLAVASLLVHIGDRLSVNGVVQYERDYGGIVCGGLAVLIAAYAAFRLRRDITDQSPTLHYLIIAAFGLLSLYQFLSGASVI